jgi:hypothetical protein
MSAQASAKAPVPKNDALQATQPAPEESKVDLSATLRIWRQVIIAEVLNLLEKRRYDACKSLSHIIFVVP